MITGTGTAGRADKSTRARDKSTDLTICRAPYAVFKVSAGGGPVGGRPLFPPDGYIISEARAPVKGFLPLLRTFFSTEKAAANQTLQPEPEDRSTAGAGNHQDRQDRQDRQKGIKKSAPKDANTVKESCRIRIFPILRTSSEA